ncbi:MAG: UvrD-helicase domain-containing protein, partial [Candidatus Hydrothermae bacterium]|nr:UvrD-helicase domain-containing protein [Candidatus Hydrothermae bacterium]
MSRDTQHLERTSLLVEAPAGSGKTFRLVERFVHLLQEETPPWEIQAVTFTDKAAREMRERVMRVLLESCPETFQKYEWYLPRLRISTFHSAYRTLLRRLALLRQKDLPGDPGFDVLDEVEAERYRQQALQEVLRTRSPGDSAVREALNPLLDRPDIR